MNFSPLRYRGRVERIRAAKLAGRSRTTFWHKRKRLGI